MFRALLRIAAVVWTLYVVLLVVQGRIQDPREILLLLLPALVAFLILSFVPSRRARVRAAEPESPAPPPRTGRMTGRLFGCGGALLVTTVGGLAVWWLTQPEGPLIEPPTPHPVVRVLSVQIPPVDLGRTNTTTATVTVHNEGDATAEGCRVNWYSHGLAYAATSSPTFALPRQETRVLNLQSLIYSSPGNYPSQTVALCSNAASSSVLGDVIVRPGM